MPIDNDYILFDRLVDGELSADERRELMSTLDDRTDGWRRCAVAFLESQTWRSEMRRLAAPSTAALSTTLAEPDPAPRSSRHRWTTASAWLSIAAALFVAFGVGWKTSRFTAPSDAALMADVSRPAPDAADRADALAAPLPDKDAITLVVQDHRGQPRRLQVPLVEGRRLGDAFADAPGWAAPDVRRQLAERGLDLQARRRYVPLIFEQENQIVPMIVPVDDAVVTPVSRPIY